jgi:hypothetical protein
MWKLFIRLNGRMYVWSVREYGAEEGIWAQEEERNRELEYTCVNEIV